jgi:hypothetical protein
VIENLQSNSNFKFLNLVFSFWRNLANKKKVMNPNVISRLPYISRVEVVGLSSSSRSGISYTFVQGLWPLMMQENYRNPHLSFSSCFASDCLKFTCPISLQPLGPVEEGMA